MADPPPPWPCVLLTLLVISSVSAQPLDEKNCNGPLTQPESSRPPPGLSSDECVNNIYRRCNYPTTFTDEELENVRQYLNYTFTQLADIKPDKPLCPKLHVRQDWKCLTDVQRQRVVEVFRQMYAQGIIQNLTDLHVENWPEWHKTGAGIPAHRWLVNEFEKYMIAINSSVTLPYWMPWTYACQPERSSIWDTLGHSGNYSNGYRVADGIYPTFNLVPAIRRHWACNNRIYPWLPIEFISSAIQTSKTISELLGQSIGFHFQPHLSIGGYEGQYAVRTAPYDAIFYMHHTADMDIVAASFEFIPSHRWLVNEFEKYMIAIDSRVTLPYWMPWTYAIQPERSSIWDTLGHAGNYSNGYRVSDGIYPTFNLVPAIRRHWGSSGRIYPWGPLKFVSSSIQTSKSMTEVIRNTKGLHFQPHLSIGGYEGQYAVRSAPYDVLFFMHHTADVDIIVASWQFLRRENLTPLSYNNGFSFNQTTGAVQAANIFTDTISGAPGVNVKDQFWLGFGDLCYIADRFVKPINRLWKGIQTNTTPQPDPIPAAVKRLPKWIVNKYFPMFLSGNFSAFSHIFEEVGECNNRCVPISKPTFMRDTHIGCLQYHALQYDNGLDLGNMTDQAEQYFYQMWLDFNSAGYCSTFVTTY